MPLSDLPPMRVREKPRRLRTRRQRCSYFVPTWTEDEAPGCRGVLAVFVESLRSVDGG